MARLYGLDSYNKAHPDIANAMGRAIARATLLIAHDPDAAKQCHASFPEGAGSRKPTTGLEDLLPVHARHAGDQPGQLRQGTGLRKVRPARAGQHAATVYRMSIDDSYAVRGLREVAH